MQTSAPNRPANTTGIAIRRSGERPARGESVSLSFVCRKRQAISSHEGDDAAEQGRQDRGMPER